MKHYLLLIFMCCFSAQAFSQNDLGEENDDLADRKVAYFYGKDLDEPLLSENNGTPMAIIMRKYGNVVRTTILDPSTQNILATIRGKMIPAYGKKGSMSAMMDSSFAFTIPKGNTYSFDAKTKTYTVLDIKGRKEAMIAYMLTKKDTNVVMSQYFINGKVMSTSTLRPLTVYTDLLNLKAAQVYLKYGGVNNNNSGYSLSFSRFYPNGKTLFSANINSKNQYDISNMKGSIMMYDSMGNKTYESNKISDFNNQKKVNMVEYSKYGKIIIATDAGLLHKSFYSLQRYDDSTGALILQSYGYIDTMPNVMVAITEKPDGFFRRDTKYKEINQREIYAGKVGMDYPLFKIERDEKGKLTGMYLEVQEKKWTHDACPRQPEFIVEGKQDGVLPDGEWRIFIPDTLGNKKSLAVVATFKKGMPNGKWFALDEAKDTLASTVYKDGIIVYNKYSAAYERLQNPEKYFLDSVNRAQNSIDSRSAARNAAQHALYEKDHKNIWQRDSLLIPVNMGGYKDDFKGSTILYIKEQLTPDSNSIMRKKYQYLNTKIPASVLRYTKKTEKIDSIATIYNKNGVMTHYLNTKTKQLKTINDNEEGDDTALMIELPNDSTMITTNFYDDKHKNIRTITVDSFAYTPSMKGEFFDKKRLAFTLDLLPIYVEFIKKRSLRSSETLASINYPVDDLPLISTQTNTYFNKNGKAVYSEVGGKHYEYAPDGKTIIATFGKDKKTWSGVKHTFNERIEEEMPYKSGKRDGEARIFYKSDTTTLFIIGKDDEEVSRREYNAKNELLWESKTIMESPHRTQIVCYNSKKEETRTEINEIIKGDYSRLIKGTYYSTDTLGKRFLAGEFKILSDSSYVLKTWYPSGKPQIEYAYFTSDGSFQQNELYKSLCEKHYDKTELGSIQNLETFQYLSFWENGNLYQQGSNPNNIFCEYDEKGRIRFENLAIEQEGGFVYPDPNKTEACNYENLPYQEGKMEGGKRIGLWKGFFRNTKKQMQYSIMYNNEGILNGALERFDTNGTRIDTRNYTRNILNGITTIYSDNKVAREIVYYFGMPIEERAYSNSGKMYSHNFISHDTIIKIEYAPQGDKMISKSISVPSQSTVLDSTFNEQGNLIGYKKYDTESGFNTEVFLNSKNKWITKYFKQKQAISASQKEYLAAATKKEEELYANRRYPREDKLPFAEEPKFNNKDSLLARMQTFKSMSFSPALTMNNYRKKTPIDTTQVKNKKDNEIDILEQLNNRKLYESYSNSFTATQYSIKDKYGQTAVFTPITPAEPIVIVIDGDSIATPVQYNPIACEQYRIPTQKYNTATAVNYAVDYAAAAAAAVDGASSNTSKPYKSYSQADYFSTLCDNKKVAAVLGAKGGMRTIWRVPANILHPKASKEDAAFILNIEQVKLVKTYPHIFQNTVGDNFSEDYQTKAQQIASYNTLKPESQEVITIEKSRNDAALQIHTIGNTNMQFIATNTTLTKGCPVLEDRQKPSVFTPLRFANHQVLDKNDNAVCDAYLQQQKLRLLSTEGYMTFAPAIKNYISTYDVLIDNEEINGSFFLNTNEINIDALLGQCRLQNIDLIICESGTLKVVPFDKIQKGEIYGAHFRYKAQ
jgi:hypothetical protein